MKRSVDYNPFEDLKEVEDLTSFVRHVLKSLEVKEIRVWLAGGFNKELIHQPDVKVPVHRIIPGSVSTAYIEHRVHDVLKKIRDIIQLTNSDKGLSIGDKIKLYEELKAELSEYLKQFNSMNRITYIAGIKWIIVYNADSSDLSVEKEEEYVYSKINLSKDDWYDINENILTKKSFLFEINNILDSESKKIKEQLISAKYQWKENEKEPFEIYELLMSIIASGRVEYKNGNEATFIHDFLKLFGKTDEGLPYFRGKVLGRVNRSPFTDQMKAALDTYGGSSVEKRSKKAKE